jgi:hypothetical protein
MAKKKVKKQGPASKIISAIFLIIVLGAIAYFSIQLIPMLKDFNSQKTFILENNNLNDNVIQNLTGIKSELSQFYKNMRFQNKSISFGFEPSCDMVKKERVRKAFDIIAEQTQALSFYEAPFIKAQIDVACSEEKVENIESNSFVAGEGGPKEIINSTIYPLILSGRILLFESPKCDYPVVEIHEIMHVFGFEHINDSKSIMYPYYDCDQTLDKEYSTSLNNLHSTKPLPDLQIETLQATKHQFYLDFNISIKNQGILDSEKMTLNIIVKNENVRKFNIEEIPVGFGRTLTVQNLKLPGFSFPQTITFLLNTTSEEYSKENNEQTITLE